MQRLRTGGLVALLCERDLTGSGIEVEFLGEPARIMGGPAALAEQTGAALMPVTLWYEGENWGAHIHQEIPVPETGTRQEKIAAMTQQLARVFENGIARHSERTGTCCRRCSSPISTPAGCAPLASSHHPSVNSAAIHVRADVSTAREGRPWCARRHPPSLVRAFAGPPRVRSRHSWTHYPVAPGRAG